MADTDLMTSSSCICTSASSSSEFCFPLMAEDRANSASSSYNQSSVTINQQCINNYKYLILQLADDDLVGAVTLVLLHVHLGVLEERLGPLEIPPELGEDLLVPAAVQQVLQTLHLGLQLVLVPHLPHPLLVLLLQLLLQHLHLLVVGQPDVLEVVLLGLDLPPEVLLHLGDLQLQLHLAGLQHVHLANQVIHLILLNKSYQKHLKLKVRVLNIESYESTLARVSG